MFHRNQVYSPKAPFEVGSLMFIHDLVKKKKKPNMTLFFQLEMKSVRNS